MLSENNASRWWAICVFLLLATTSWANEWYSMSCKGDPEICLVSMSPKFQEAYLAGEYEEVAAG